MGAFGWGSNLANAYMKLWMIANAFRDAFDWRKRRKIDIIGFDACFMSSFEVAHALRPYARYMLASEETEPNKGWDYKNYKISSYNVSSRLSSVKGPLGLGKASRFS